MCIWTLTPPYIYMHMHMQRMPGYVQAEPGRMVKRRTTDEDYRPHRFKL